jgi:hypothetical protein
LGDDLLMAGDVVEFVANSERRGNCGDLCDERCAGRAGRQASRGIICLATNKEHGF